MKVFLVWQGEYSDASVVAVFSTLELAEAAAKLYPGGWIDVEDGYEVDAAAVQVRAGIGRWRVRMDLADGNIPRPPESPDWLGTGEPPEVRAGTRTVGPLSSASKEIPILMVSCDARDKDHAIKIAGDERAKYLALSQSSGPRTPGSPSG